MVTKRAFIILFLIFLLFISIGCSIHPKIKPETAYIKVKPIAPLPEIDNEMMPHNLEIIVENVADMNNSYKNRLELFVNKFIIEPDEEYNFKDRYVYKLKLQPGQYKVRAKYYAHSGWVEQGFTIKTRENVKIYLNKKTVLTINLEKNHWGGLKDKESYFKIKQTSLD